MISTSFQPSLRRFAGSLAALALLAGCGDDAPGPAPEPFDLTIADSTHVLDALAREPMVVRHPSGAWFVAGYGEPGPKLWTSGDGGRSWKRVVVGTEADGAVANSDVDLAVGPDGTLYFATMGFDRTRLEGTHIVIGVSHDVGVTWTWTRLSNDRFDDRPWVKVAPDGTAHVVWNDGGGVCHATSRDGGRTWREHPRIHPSGGSSHLAVGPNGEVAVRIVPLSASGNRIDRDTDLIAVSSDGGATWTRQQPPGARKWGFPIGNPADLPRWVEPIAFDADGSLYYLWSNGETLWLARSQDLGASWRLWRVMMGPSRLYFPYLIARGSGELAAAWVSDTGSAMRVQAARITLEPDPSAPRIAIAAPFEIDSWAPWLPSERPWTRDPAGEYFGLAWADGGRIALVTPLQNTRASRLGFSFWRLEPSENARPKS